MKNLEALHPGMVLKTMFLEPLKLSVYRVAKDIHVPQTRLSQIIAGEHRTLRCGFRNTSA